MPRIRPPWFSRIARYRYGNLGLSSRCVFGEGVCPAKAGMFSGRQSHRGKSRSPVAWVAFVGETKRMKPTDKAALGAVSESPGRNESPIKGDVKRHFSPARRAAADSFVHPAPSPVCATIPVMLIRRRSARVSSETADSHSQRFHARARDDALRLL